ncbi:MAG: FecR domain-containing protein [Deltaproteobacteria bacterium]|nr:FecR domain-containing protein [Deltaproteobacteria bacterium]
MTRGVFYRFCVAFILFAVPAGQLFADDIVGHLTKVQGHVVLSKTGRDHVRTAKPGDHVEVGEFFQTGKNARAQLVLTDNSIISIYPETSLAVLQYVNDPAVNRRSVIIKVRDGGARFMVTRPQPRVESRFTVLTDHASVSVWRADFFVSTSPAETEIVNIGTSFTVAHISKLIVQKVRLDANQRTIVTDKMPPSQPTTLTPTQRKKYIKYATGY